MGSPETEKDRRDDEGPQKRIEIAQGFWMGKYEVTQAQWQAVMGTNGSVFNGADRPLDSVSWLETREFFSAINSRTPSGQFRLPTEAEWEYACRAGTTTRFYYGDDPEYRSLDAYAWHAGNAGFETQPVGQKKPNGWGLYDMYGNVEEWCSDRYAPYRERATGTQGESTMGIQRVLRGGNSLELSRSRCRSASRYSCWQFTRLWQCGFRIVWTE